VFPPISMSCAVATIAKYLVLLMFISSPHRKWKLKKKRKRTKNRPSGRWARRKAVYSYLCSVIRMKLMDTRALYAMFLPFGA
jgi:hypothetical protein